MSNLRESTPDCAGNESYRSSPGEVDQQITPRSKIRALLATVDDSSDGSPTKRKTARPTGGDTAEAHNSYLEAQKPASLDNDSSDSDALPAKRHKSSHFRSRAVSGGVEEFSDSSDGENSNAYERVKRNLLSKATQQGSTSHESTNGAKSPNISPHITRKFLQRKKIPSSGLSAHQAGTGIDSTAADAGSHLEASTGSANHPEQAQGTQKSEEVSQDAGNGDKVSASEDSDGGLTDPLKKKRFWNLVQRKREEREAKEAQEEAKRKNRKALAQARSSMDSGHQSFSGLDSDMDDDAADVSLTQPSRPARKASKKAMEEMSRETQRISRNMQLTHEATTVKKITKESLMDRFKVQSKPSPVVGAVQNSSSVASSVPASDAETSRPYTSPLTSPGLPIGNETWRTKAASCERISNEPFANDEPPQGPASGSGNLDKGKGKAILPPIEASSSKKPMFTQRPIKIRPPERPTRPQGYMMDSGSDLEIEIEAPTKAPKSRKVRPRDKARSKAFAALSRIPEKKKTAQDRSAVTLRFLAHLTFPGKKQSNHGTMSHGDLQASLRARARQQAAREGAEKLQDLRDRGIVVQTAEEREKEQIVVEDLLEKARQEVKELTKKERDADKREKRNNGEDVELSSSDEEFVDDVEDDQLDAPGHEEDSGRADEEEDEEAESDSEDESGEEDIEDIEDNLSRVRQDELDKRNSLIENEAIEDDSDGSEGHESIENERESDGEMAIDHAPRRRLRKAVLDDEDVDDEPAPAATPPSANRPVNPFGAAGPGDLVDAPMGLTQAFAATMAETQDPQEEDSMADLPGFTLPEPPSPGLGALIADSQDPAAPGQDEYQILQSQADETQGLDLHYSQSQIIQDSFRDENPVTRDAPSQMPDPTQDHGFEHESPLKARFAQPPPQSTVDTVLLARNDAGEELSIKRKGRLRRRAEAAVTLSDTDEDNLPVASDKGEFEISANVFDVMKKAVKKPTADPDDFRKKDSKAKEMVEEQAEESEDEYAGLGGASDDNSEAEDDEDVQKMIDAEDVHVDERKLAAFHANKERMSDEKVVEKLYRDINTGGLRRKRGANLDLSDSDDELEARRSRKRREFARMQKALLEDANVKQIAEDPKKLAFFRAIEDRDEDEDDIEILAESPEATEDQPDTQMVPESQAEDSGAVAGKDVQAAGHKRKRPLEEAQPDPANRRPPGPSRRTNATRKPLSLADMRESLSFLTEHPADTALAAPADPSSEVSDLEDENRWTRRRRPAAEGIVDRLSIKRTDSAASAGSAAGSGVTRMAFHDPSAVREPAGFRVPSLLRRATSSLSTDEHGISHGRDSSGGHHGDRGEGVRIGGTKKSGVGYLVKREREKKFEVRIEERLFETGRSGKSGRRGKPQESTIAGLCKRGSWE